MTEIESPGRLSSAWGRTVAIRRALKGLGQQAGRFVRPERPEEVLEGAEFFRLAPTSVDPEFLDVLWRGEALLAASAVCLKIFEDELIQYTRKVFHDAPGHHGLSEALFGRDYGAIHRWMDTVPGAKFAGGGIPIGFSTDMTWPRCMPSMTGTDSVSCANQVADVYRSVPQYRDWYHCLMLSDPRYRMQP